MIRILRADVRFRHQKHIGIVAVTVSLSLGFIIGCLLAKVLS